MTWWNEWREQAALRSEIRECCSNLPLAAQHDPKVTLRELGGRGWIGLEWEAGGAPEGRDPSWTSAAVGAEYGYSWLPTLPAYLGNDIAGSTLDLVGTTLQRERFLPGIATGSLLLSLGYTEPDSGSDLASMRTVSRRQGTDYVVNGTKVFISFAEYADYLLLATRAVDWGDDGRAHTVLLVDTALSGVEITSMPTWEESREATVVAEARPEGGPERRQLLARCRGPSSGVFAKPSLLPAGPCALIVCE